MWQSSIPTSFKLSVLGLLEGLCVLMWDTVRPLQPYAKRWYMGEFLWSKAHEMISTVLLNTSVQRGARADASQSKSPVAMCQGVVQGRNLHSKQVARAAPCQSTVQYYCPTLLYNMRRRVLLTFPFYQQYCF